MNKAQCKGRERQSGGQSGRRAEAYQWRRSGGTCSCPSTRERSTRPSGTPTRTRRSPRAAASCSCWTSCPRRPPLSRLALRLPIHSSLQSARAHSSQKRAALVYFLSSKRTVEQSDKYMYIEIFCLATSFLRAGIFHCWFLFSIWIIHYMLYSYSNGFRTRIRVSAKHKSRCDPLQFRSRE